MKFIYVKDVRSRGELVRLFCQYFEIDYEEILVDYMEFVQGDRKVSKLGYLPTIEVDGVKYGETLAITHYLAETKGLIPKNDPLENLNTLQWESYFLSLQEAYSNGFHELFVQSAMTETKINEDALSEQNKATWKHVHERLQRIEAEIQKNGGKFVTKREQDGHVEVILFTLLDYMHTPFPKSLDLQQYKSLHALYQRIQTHPPMEKYLKNRPPALF